MSNLTQQLNEILESMGLSFDDDEEEKRLEAALRFAHERIKQDQIDMSRLRENLEEAKESESELEEEVELLTKELANCRDGNPGQAVKGVIRFLDEGGNKMANTVNLKVTQTVVATIDWTDVRGNVALAPTNLVVTTDPGVTNVVNADGTITFTPVGPLGLNNVTVNGDGLAAPAAGTVTVEAGPAVAGVLNFGTPV